MRVNGHNYYNQSGVTELLIMRDPHYSRMCFNSVLKYTDDVSLLLKQ